jgi:hypothetical protein
MVDEAPITVALWGPSAAGKTMLVAQLYQQQSSAAASAWDVLPHPTMPTTAEFVQLMRKDIRANNLFPKATAIKDDRRREGSDQIVYLFRHRETGRTVTVSIEDRPGKEWENLDNGAKERLREAKGLLLLFDPTRALADLEDEVLRTLEHISGTTARVGEKERRPVAVCMSKADLLVRSLHEVRQATANPHEFVRDRMNPIIEAAFQRYLDKFRFYPVSAVGIRPRRGVLEPMVFFDEQLVPRICSEDGEPLNLMAAFSWLFDAVGGR